MADDTFIILDGGMGRALQEAGIAKSGGIWSAEALIDHQDAVHDLHVAFLEAGADVITTNTYSVVPKILARGGIEEGLEKLLSVGMFIAHEARNEVNLRARIAAPLPPLDMSYRPDLVGSLEEMEETYRRIVDNTLYGVDLYICETMSCISESVAAVRATQNAGRRVPVWVSWTLDDDANGLLRSGESIEEAVRAHDDHIVDAFLFNCSSIESIDRALPELRELTDHSIGAYANLFQPVPKDYVMGATGDHPKRDDVTVEVYVEAAGRWREFGASIIGGCCGIGPEYIEAISAALK